MEILHRAQMGHDVHIYGIHTYHIYIYINKYIIIYIYILGECSALWGEREGVVGCISVSGQYISHSHNNSLIPSSSHLQYLFAYGTGGGNGLGKRLGYQMYACVH